MKKRKIRVEITVVTERVFDLRAGRRTLPAWCEGCGAEVSMVLAFDAASQAAVSTRTIHGWAETGAIHSHVTGDGVLFVCPASLARRCRGE